MKLRTAGVLCSLAAVRSATSKPLTAAFIANGSDISLNVAKTSQNDNKLNLKPDIDAVERSFLNLQSIHGSAPAVLSVQSPTRTRIEKQLPVESEGKTFLRLKRRNQKSRPRVRQVDPALEWPSLLRRPDNCSFPIDVLILQDLSDSFGTNLKQMAESEIPTMMDLLSVSHPGSRFGVATFEDKPVLPFGWPDDSCWNLVQPLTSDRDLMVEAYKNMNAGGGNDWMENQFGAMVAAPQSVSVGWKHDPAVAKLLVMVTDSNAHHADDGLNSKNLARNPGLWSEQMNERVCKSQYYPSLSDVRMVLEAGGFFTAFIIQEGLYPLQQTSSFWKYTNSYLGQPDSFVQVSQMKDENSGDYAFWDRLAKVISQLEKTECGAAGGPTQPPRDDSGHVVIIKNVDVRKEVDVDKNGIHKEVDVKVSKKVIVGESQQTTPVPTNQPTPSTGQASVPTGTVLSTATSLGGVLATINPSSNTLPVGTESGRTSTGPADSDGLDVYTMPYTEYDEEEPEMSKKQKRIARRAQRHVIKRRNRNDDEVTIKSQDQSTTVAINQTTEVAEESGHAEKEEDIRTESGDNQEDAETEAEQVKLKPRQKIKERMSKRRQSRHPQEDEDESSVTESEEDVQTEDGDEIPKKSGRRKVRDRMRERREARHSEDDSEVSAQVGAAEEDTTESPVEGDVVVPVPEKKSRKQIRKEKRWARRHPEEQLQTTEAVSSSSSVQTSESRGADQTMINGDRVTSVSPNQSESSNTAVAVLLPFSDNPSRVSDNGTTDVESDVKESRRQERKAKRNARREAKRQKKNAHSILSPYGKPIPTSKPLTFRQINTRPGNFNLGHDEVSSNEEVPCPSFPQMPGRCIGKKSPIGVSGEDDKKSGDMKLAYGSRTAAVVPVKVV